MRFFGIAGPKSLKKTKRSIRVFEEMPDNGMVHEQLNPRRPFEIRIDRVQTIIEGEYVRENTIALTAHDSHSILHHGSFWNSICLNKDDRK